MSDLRRNLTPSVLIAASLAFGCNALDQPPDNGPDGIVDRGLNPTVTAPTGVPPMTAPGGFAGTGFIEPPLPPDAFPGFIDDSPVLTPEKAPPPIEGGTLLLTADGSLAVAADPDRDRVTVVSLTEQRIVHDITLNDGDVPGRLVEDADGQIHVVLRAAGAVATIDPIAGEVLGRTEVCGVPRGIDYRASSDSVLVACAGGELVEVAPEGGIKGTRMIEPDLQDVVVTGDDRLFVTTFKRAELLQLGAAGEVLSRVAPDTLQGPFFGVFTDVVPDAQTLEPAVAWAALRGPDDSVAIVHQRAQVEEVQIEHGDDDEADAFMDPEAGGGYGGSSFGPDCNAIVQNGVSVMDPAGNMRSIPPMPTVVLPVDGAISPDGRWLAIAAAGSQGQVQNNAFPDPLGSRPGAAVIDLEAETPPDLCMIPGFDVPGALIETGQAIGVAFDPEGRLVVQTRDPNTVKVYPNVQSCGIGTCDTAFTVNLGGVAMRDTGHDLFHFDAGRGVACASCHPGGGDDGRTWVFSGLGPRRTQLFNMGIKGTEPLHWDGDMATFDELVGEVFVRRMGGTSQSAPRVAAMADWIDTLTPHPPLREATEPAVERGKTLFESEEVGCSGCHNGELMTNNASFDVGTGGVFQVPSLVNVVYHQPYIHTGCAETLHERFDPSCGGGDMHGKTTHLSESEVDDLVAYLESL